MCTENMPKYQGIKSKARVKKRDFIKALKLADTSTSPECSIDMLIGSDMYWDFATGETKRNPGENLVALNSIWLAH